tara:strand:- start:265 stop:459 length:195 start_codon:yes stop_codon:yes gene_type:complete
VELFAEGTPRVDLAEQRSPYLVTSLLVGGKGFYVAHEEFNALRGTLACQLAKHQLISPEGSPRT